MLHHLFIPLVLLLGGSTALAQAIDDPIADFLSLPIEDRYSDASRVVRVVRASIDIDLDGRPEILIGHPKPWLGDNNGVYYAVYRQVADGGFKRLTKPDQDIRLVFPDEDNLARFVFVGHIDELRATGLLACQSPKGDPYLGTKRVENRVFLSLKNDGIQVDELPPLDLRNPRDLSFYNKYYPRPGEQGGYKAESLTPDALMDNGVSLPDWTKSFVRKVSAKSADNLEGSSEGSAGKPRRPSDVYSIPPKEEKTVMPWLVTALVVIGSLGILYWRLKKRPASPPV